MTDYELKNIDSEDIEDLLVEVEKSFGISFVGNELAHIATFGELCDHIADKIKLDNSNDCTSQQAFYKLREAILTTLQIDNKIITPDFPLTKILPRQNRRSTTKKLENHLGFKLNILRAPNWVTKSLLIVLIISIIGIFFNWRIGILGSVFSICGLQLSKRIGNELDLMTIGDVAEKMTRENYLKSRRNQNTFNKREIEKILTDWFSVYFDLDKSKLTREAEFK
ncbi:acyl carrier protein [Flavobacterium sp.]|uniref:acyl carrier protein n=1 Tax=Flavobacterium sp. TaxID=239 RepID=UPI003D2AFAAA